MTNGLEIHFDYHVGGLPLQNGVPSTSGGRCNASRDQLDLGGWGGGRMRVNLQFCVKKKKKKFQEVCGRWYNFILSKNNHFLKDLLDRFTSSISS